VFRASMIIKRELCVARDQNWIRELSGDYQRHEFVSQLAL